jgi:hypothetical protein
MNALEAEIAKFVSQRFADVGEITLLELVGADVSATLTLQGQAEPVSFRVTGLNWSSDGTTFTLRFREASCSLPWLHAVLLHWCQRTESTVTLRENLRLLPLKFKLPRAA